MEPLQTKCDGHLYNVVELLVMSGRTSRCCLRLQCFVQSGLLQCVCFSSAAAL